MPDIKTHGGSAANTRIIKALFVYKSMCPFLDTPDLIAYVLTAKIKGYKEGDVRKKSRECRAMWDYHLNSPDLLMPLAELSKKTRENLEILSREYKWEAKAHVWIVDQYHRGYFDRKAKDILVKGHHISRGPVRYWRHETRSSGAGQSMITWKEGKKKKRIKITAEVVRLKG